MVLLVAVFKPPHTLLFALAVRHVGRTPPILQTSFHSCSATGWIESRWPRCTTRMSASLSLALRSARWTNRLNLHFHFTSKENQRGSSSVDFSS